MRNYRFARISTAALIALAACGKTSSDGIVHDHEPNDVQGEAQSLGSGPGPVRLEGACSETNDAADWYSIATAGTTGTITLEVSTSSPGVSSLHLVVVGYPASIAYDQTIATPATITTSATITTNSFDEELLGFECATGAISYSATITLVQ